MQQTGQLPKPTYIRKLAGHNDLPEILFNSPLRISRQMVGLFLCLKHATGMFLLRNGIG
jgi:hypothetical protein